MKRRLQAANAAALLGTYPLFVLAIAYVHGWWSAGVIVAWMLFFAGETALWLWAQAGIALREEQRRHDDQPPNPFIPPSFYCAECREWSLGGLLAFREHRREHAEVTA